MPPALLAKIVALLTELDCSRWRDGPIARGMKHTTCARITKAARAVLNLAMRRDPRTSHTTAGHAVATVLGNARVRPFERIGGRSIAETETATRSYPTYPGANLAARTAIVKRSRQCWGIYAN